MKKAQILFCKQAYKDFRIFDEKAGLRRLLRGDKTDGLFHKKKASSLLYRKTSEAVQAQRSRFL